MPFPDSSMARLGRFSQIRSLGEGATGQVYYAKDNLGRAVAVKELRPSQAGFPQRRDTFEIEARIQAALKHPNIIAVYHFEEDPQSGELYLISEYANGSSLADHLRANGPLSEPQALAIALDVCAALTATSAGQIVHRDVKPGNILLSRDDQGRIVQAMLGDFGVARDLRRRPTTVLAGHHHPATPEYAAPEQDQISRPVDVRTDLYALGISLWESLTCTSYKALLAQPGAPDLRAFCPHCSDDSAAIIRRATQADPALRYQTAQAMASDLRDVLEGRPLKASETRLWSDAYTAPRTSAPRQIRPHPSSGSPRQIRGTPRLAVMLLVALLGITALGLALASRGWPAAPPGGVNTAALPVASASPGPSAPCRFNNLMECSELVPVFQPGNSEATATRYDTGEVRIAFRNQSAGSGLALQFAPNLDVSGFTRVELVATADQPFAFLVEYKAGIALEIVQVSPQRRFGQGTNIIEVPITYDGTISELVFNFVTHGEAANFTIESLRLR